VSLVAPILAAAALHPVTWSLPSLTTSCCLAYAHHWVSLSPRSPRHRITLLRRSTAVKAAALPRCWCQAPGDTACGPSSLQFPSPVLRRYRALARPCAPQGQGQHPPCPAHHPDTSVWTKLPPLACPSRHPLLLSLCVA
jgi:hypothetical protein